MESPDLVIKSFIVSPIARGHWSGVLVVSLFGVLAASVLFAVTNFLLYLNWGGRFGRQLQSSMNERSVIESNEQISSNALTIERWSPRSNSGSLTGLIAETPYIDGILRDDAHPNRSHLSRNNGSTSTRLPTPKIKAIRRYMAKRAIVESKVSAQNSPHGANPAGNKLEAKVTTANRTYPCVFVVELRHESFENLEYVTMDIACWVSAGMSAEDTGKDGTTELQLRRVPWWETRDLAVSNRMIQVAKWGGTPPCNHILSFDSAPASLCSWMRTHWLPVSQIANPDYKSAPSLRLSKAQINELAGLLEFAMNDDWRGLRFHWSVVMLRVINGFIQWLTVAAFLALLGVLASRWLLFISQEYGALEAIKTLSGTGSASSLTREGESGKPRRHKIAIKAHEGAVRSMDESFKHTWGGEPIVVGMAIDIIEAIDGGAKPIELPGLVSGFGDVQLGVLTSSGFFPRFLLGAMPALGFVGTVMGIGDALMGTGSVLSDELSKQQSGVGAVALALGFAFDTTFIALVLSLVGTLLATWVVAEEEKLVFRAQEELLRTGGSSLELVPKPATANFAS